MSSRDVSIRGDSVREQTLRGEVGQSLSLILLTVLVAAGVLGLGLLGARLLG